MTIDERIEQAAAYQVREGNDKVREAVEEVREACRPPEHVRPVNVDRMGMWLSGRVAA